MSQRGAVKGVPSVLAGAAAMDGVSPNGMSCVDIAARHDYLVVSMYVFSKQLGFVLPNRPPVGHSLLYSYI